MTHGPSAVAIWAAAFFLFGCGDDSRVLATGSGAGGSSTGGPDGGAGLPGAGGAGGAQEPGAGGSTQPSAGGAPTCTAAGATETACTGGVDEDCDGYVDCRDSDCEGQSCGAGDLTCTFGGCLAPGATGLPDLPRIDNVRVTQRGDTTIVEFEPVAGARDYRIYPLPSVDDVLVGQNGEVTVRNAIYRCAGDRPFMSRPQDPGALYDASLSGGANLINNFERQAADSVLGYVYLTPGADRQPVYRMSDPDETGGYLNADWVPTVYFEGNMADYVVGTAERDRLLAAGMRDHGVVFYVPDSASRSVFRKKYEGLWNGSVAVFFTEGAEYDYRQAEDGTNVVEFGERFKVLATEEAGSVALHRVLYNDFDVLAAGDARYQRVLEQGNQAVWAVAWPGLKGPTTLVVEALDQGCPFPNGYIAAHSAPADDFNFPSITLDEARLASGEVFINGQHAPENRPKPVARAFVDAVPEAKPTMDFFESFDEGSTWDPFAIDSGNNGVFIYRNSKWAVDFSGCTSNLTLGPMLGQLVVGFADYGSSCNMSMVPLGVEPQLGAADYLHVRMSTDVPSTGRRYPQLMITTTPVLNPGDIQPLDSVPLHARLGPLPFDTGAPPGDQRSIVVQPFAGFHQLEVQFCDQRGWGVNAQCPKANTYGSHAGDYTETWEERGLPVPVLGEVAGFDLPVQLDVYASTERVYVFMNGAPAGCAVLPAGRMPAGPVNVAFRAVLYHSGIDESVVPDNSGHQYLKRFSLGHFDRHMDDFGIERNVPAPAWDESRLPCGSRWYGGG